VPALFGVSPYVTRWMLLRHFIHGDPIGSPEHNRMDWGTKMQPLLLAQAAADLHLEVRPNASNTYIRRGLIGCTRDAEIVCPHRGPGALETKCVFDYGVWMREWDGGKTPPKQHEIQLQEQMMVGAGGQPFTWGVLAVWIAGEMRYFERKPIGELWDAIEVKATEFFEDVHAKREGDPFAESVEWDLLSKLFVPRAGTKLDFRERPDAEKLADDIRLMNWHAEERKGHERGEKTLKTKLKALIGDAEESTFADGITVRQKQIARKGFTVEPTTYTSITIHIPEDEAQPTQAVFDNVLAGG